MDRRLFIAAGLASGAGAITAGLSRAGRIPSPPPLQTVASSPTSPETLLRFAGLADTGTGDAGQYAVAKALEVYRQAHPFDLALLAGDNIYTNGEIEKIGAVFEKPYASFLKDGVEFRAVLGNHDIRVANGDPQVAYPAFNMQGRYYTFSKGPVQFFALDTNVNAPWEQELVWLKDQLSRSSSQWKIVYGHHPIYSSGHYGVSQPLVQALTPLFKTYGVQLYICGHDHNYERTRAIDGTTYIVQGSGAGIRPVGKSDWTALSASRLASVVYEVSDAISIKALGTDGQIFDQAVLG